MKLASIAEVKPIFCKDSFFFNTMHVFMHFFSHKYKTSHLREKTHSRENANSKRAFLHHDATMILQKIAIFRVKPQLLHPT